MTQVNYQQKQIMGMDLIEARYKGVYMQLGYGKDDDGTNWLSIYMCKSNNQGKGEVQEMIDLIRKDYPDYKLYGSVPLNSVMKHIYDKKDVIYSMTEL